MADDFLDSINAAFDAHARRALTPFGGELAPLASADASTWAQRIRDARGPSWLSRALAEQRAAHAAYVQGGPRAMMRDTSAGQELASAFGGGGMTKIENALIRGAQKLGGVSPSEIMLGGLKKPLAPSAQSAPFDPAMFNASVKGLPFEEMYDKIKALPDAHLAALKAHNELTGATANATPSVQSAPSGPSFGVGANEFEQHALTREPGAEWGDYDAMHENFVGASKQDLLKSEKESVGYWSTPEGYKQINGSLRGTVDSVSAEQHIDNLDSAIAGTKLQGNGLFWRGVNKGQKAALEALSAGDSFHNAGYTATTLDPRRATHYGGKEDPGALIAYHLPEGYNGLYTSHPDAGAWSEAEREMLLPHGAQFKLIGTEEISAPRWHYSGDVTSAEPQKYKVYHVFPDNDAWAAPGASKQLDQMPGAPSVGPSPAWAQGSKWEPAPSEQGPSLSDKSISQQLENNPGASIFDIAGTSAPTPKPQPPGPDYGGYSILPKHGDKNAFSVYDPGGKNIGDINNENDYWSPNIKDDRKGELYKGFATPGEALEHIATHHPNLVESGNIYERHLKPLDWNALRSPVGARSALPPHALEQGYNPLYPLYKGVEGESGEGYPKTVGNSILEGGKKTWERGLFFSDEPSIGGAYAGIKNAPLEYVARAKNPLTVDWAKATGMPSYDTTPMHNLIEAARKKGADLLHITNMRDIGREEGPQNQVVALDPSVLRAPHAKFDPAKMSMNAPLAGLAAAGATPLFFDKQGNMLLHIGAKPEEKEDGNSAQ
jgi:hypothetical protein